MANLGKTINDVLNMINPQPCIWNYNSKTKQWHATCSQKYYVALSKEFASKEGKLCSQCGKKIKETYEC